MTKLAVKGVVAAGQKQLLFHPELCVGCHLCSYACSLSKFGEASKKKTAIRIVRNEFLELEYPHYCIQCDDKPCMTACPTDALVWDAKLGIVDLIEEACIGCGLCAKACPYDAIAYQDHEVVKCDLCHGNPVCTTYCPTMAIEYREADAPDLQDRVTTLTQMMPHAHPRFEVTKEVIMREGKKAPPPRSPEARQKPPGMDARFWAKVKAGEAPPPADMPAATKAA